MKHTPGDRGRDADLGRGSETCAATLTRVRASMVTPCNVPSQDEWRLLLQRARYALPCIKPGPKSPVPLTRPSYVHTPT